MSDVQILSSESTRLTVVISSPAVVTAVVQVSSQTQVAARLQGVTLVQPAPWAAAEW